MVHRRPLGVMRLYNLVMLLNNEKVLLVKLLSPVFRILFLLSYFTDKIADL